jgi:DNA topoisomerase-1
VGRLRRSDPAGKGYLRVKSGRGYSYRDWSGMVVRDSELRERFAALAIPPAWSDVWIAPFPNGHIQATGVDVVGRRQYLYHAQWRDNRDREKFDRALELAVSLPAARAQVTRALRTSADAPARCRAAAFRLLDSGSLRIGSERYLEANGSHGLSTLLCSHVTVRADTVSLCFPAKSGQTWESDIQDADLAAFVQDRLRHNSDAPLLSWLEENSLRTLSSTDINEFVRERTGGEFTAKDFRTLHGTVAAATSLARNGAAETGAERARAVRQAMADAAAVLGNTPAIAKKSYVDPRLIDRYLSGETIDPAHLGSAETELRKLLG